MALVQGEDSESDEEINTDQLMESVGLSLATANKVYQQQPDSRKAGIVAGEESETDEEEEEEEESREQTDSGGRLLQPPSSSSSPRGSPRRSSLDSNSSAPQSLLHKKLRDTNVSLRRSIVERILKLYHTTCRNLTVVNDNLTRAQGTIEKVNAHLKRSDQDLTQLNAAVTDINKAAEAIAPNINIKLVLAEKPQKSVRKSPPSAAVARATVSPEAGSEVTSSGTSDS